MARVDAYLTASGDNGKSVSLGGRSANSSIQATINTDNGTHNDCNVNVSVHVRGDRELGGKPRKSCHSCSHKWSDGVLRGGSATTQDAEYCLSGDKCPKCETLRQGQDTRVSVFEIETPEQDDEYCLVYVNGKNIHSLVFCDDEAIVEQVKRRGLYNRVVEELFGKNPLVDNVLELAEVD